MVNYKLNILFVTRIFLLPDVAPLACTEISLIGRFKLPPEISLTTITFIIFQFEPVVKKGNEGIVHHLVVYACPGNYNDSHYGSGYDCEDPNMPLRECYGSQIIVAAWGVGGEVRSFG